MQVTVWEKKKQNLRKSCTWMTRLHVDSQWKQKIGHQIWSNLHQCVKCKIMERSYQRFKQNQNKQKITTKKEEIVLQEMFLHYQGGSHRAISQKRPISVIYSRWAKVSESHVPQKKETKIQQTPDRTKEIDSSADLSAVHQNLLIEGWLLKEEKQRGKASGVPKYTRIELKISGNRSVGEMSPNLKLVAKIIFKEGGQERQQ